MVVCVAVLFLYLVCHVEYTKQHFHDFILYLSLGFVKGEENDSKCHWASALVCQLDSRAWNSWSCFDHLSGFKMLVRRAGSCVSMSACPRGPDCREQGLGCEEPVVLHFWSLVQHLKWKCNRLRWNWPCKTAHRESLEWGMVSHTETAVSFVLCTLISKF